MFLSLILTLAVGRASFYYTDIDGESMLLSVILLFLDFILLVALARIIHEVTRALA